MERFSLKGTTALVTASSRGLGAGIAIALAEAGGKRGEPWLAHRTQRHTANVVQGFRNRCGSVPEVIHETDDCMSGVCRISDSFRDCSNTHSRSSDAKSICTQMNGLSAPHALMEKARDLNEKGKRSRRSKQQAERVSKPRQHDCASPPRWPAR